MLKTTRRRSAPVRSARASRSGVAVGAIAVLVTLSVGACQADDVITTVIGLPDTLRISVLPGTSGTYSGTVTALTLSVGETATLRVTALNAIGLSVGSPAVTWTSTAPNVASVSGDGVVTAVSPGDAVIRAAAGDVVSRVEVTVGEAASGPAT